jgi:predicted nucleotidyltransferase component of viral defense system
VTDKNSIRSYFKEEFLPVVQQAANKYAMDFDKEEFLTQGKRYCPDKANNNVFRFFVYANKNDSNPIKIEVHISEKLQEPPIKRSVQQLNKQSKHLTYPLKNHTITVSSLQEIIREKIRAMLTRPEGIQERDIFDLFIIHQKEPIFPIHKDKQQQKIATSFVPKAQENIHKRLDELTKYELFEEIQNMALQEIDEKKYKKFFSQLQKEIIRII